MGALLALLLLAQPVHSSAPPAGAGPPGQAAPTGSALEAEPPAASTGAAKSSAAASVPLRHDSPFNLDFLFDEYGTHVQLQYRLRWDLADVKRLPRATSDALFNPIDTLTQTGLDLTRGANIGVYGLRIRPQRMVRFEDDAGASASASTGAAAGARVSEGRRRIRLSLDPVIDDIRRDLSRSIRRQLLKEGFDAAAPGYRGATYEQKEAVTDDALRAIEDLGDDFGVQTPTLPKIPTLPRIPIIEKKKPPPPPADE